MNIKLADFLERKKSPLSVIVKEKIIEYIEQENLKPGDKLPSETDFVNIFNVSRVTLREAIAQLSQEGIVFKKQGKGTFLRKKPLKMESGLENLGGVTEVIENLNYEPSTEYIKVEITEPTKEIKEKLDLKEGEKIVTYYRKRYANKEFAVYSISSVPIKIFKGNIPKFFPKESMIRYFEEDLGITINGALAEIQPFFFDKNEAKNLKISEDILFLLLKQTVYDYSSLPIIYSLDYYNATLFKFYLNRKRIH